MRKLTLLLGAIAFGACASPGIPPGGPVDKDAPKVIGIVPDSGKLNVSPQAVIFHFDELVAERPSGATNLEQLFLISPRDGAPSVDWKRKDLTVRPAKGWKPNTTYVVSLLPGLSDLRGNTRNEGAETVFSTGPVLATQSIRGKVWNWIGGVGVSQPYIEAVHLSDSLRFVTYGDTTGAFQLSHLPSGQFLVRGIIDENKNRALDPREAWDSTTIEDTKILSVSLFAIVRDSTPPTIGAILADDSVTLRISFDRALNPGALPTAAEIKVQGSDSVRIPVVSVSVPAPDSVAADKRPPRAPPSLFLLVRLGTPIRPGAEYKVSITRVKGMGGTAVPAVRTFKAPAVVPGKAPPSSD